jgi:L-aminopeptidase/D-esterase-like protein
MRAGPHNALTDVAGLRVGHARVAGALSGVTVVLAPPGGAVAGVDVRGAAPGTRETDLLDPGATVPRVHALVLSGGSAFGLAAADGVMARLAGAGVGFPVPGAVVPIVPSAVLFDLGRGGAAADPARRPTAAVGATAVDAAVDGPVAQGVVGAGVGALVGGLKGGIGTASAVLDLEPGAGEVRDGGAGRGADRGRGRAGGRGATVTVAALVAVNAAGSAVDPATGGLLGARLGLPGEFALPGVGAAARAALRATAASVRPRLGTATTLAVVATDVALDKAGCARLATMGHDGLARALAPAHTATDGDTVFGLATGAHPALDLPGLVALQAAAADVVSRAVVHAVLAAETATTPAGTWRSYLDVVASNPG